MLCPDLEFSTPNAVKLNSPFPKMNKGLVMLLERSADQMLRTLHAGVEHDRRVDGPNIMLICRIAYDPTGSRPNLGPEVDGGYRVFLGERMT